MKDILQKFKTDFLFTDEEKFIGCNARGTSWQTVRQTLTNESYAIYAQRAWRRDVPLIRAGRQ